ncbi:hypothetical protein NN561_012792 [Cricetulus griseus]
MSPGRQDQTNVGSRGRKGVGDSEWLRMGECSGGKVCALTLVSLGGERSTRGMARDRREQRQGDPLPWLPVGARTASPSPSHDVRAQSGLFAPSCEVRRRGVCQPLQPERVSGARYMRTLAPGSQGPSGARLTSRRSPSTSFWAAAQPGSAPGRFPPSPLQLAASLPQESGGSLEPAVALCSEVSMSTQLRN